jgi:hypothetical protein
MVARLRQGDWTMWLFDDVSRDPDRDLAARDDVMN